MPALRCLTLVRDVGNSSNRLRVLSGHTTVVCSSAKVVSHGRYVAFQMAEVDLTANVPGDFAAHSGTEAAAITSASVIRSMDAGARTTNGRSESQCQGKES